jgi:peptidyl-tRNA hydrolase
MYKIYCVFSKESLKKMNGIRGKMTSQSGHAFLHAFWDAETRFPNDASAYRNGDHARKITLVTDTDEELSNLVEEYKDICGATLVCDLGFTVFKEPTVTCAGIGPISDEKILESIRKLRVLT